MIDIALHLRQNKCKYQFRFYVLRSNIHDRFQINEILRIFNQNRDREREKKRQFIHLTEFFNTTSLFFPNIQSVVRIKAINLVRKSMYFFSIFKQKIPKTGGYPTN